VAPALTNLATDDLPVGHQYDQDAKNPRRHLWFLQRVEESLAGGAEVWTVLVLCLDNPPGAIWAIDTHTKPFVPLQV
jgi:hypothetical protein